MWDRNPPPDQPERSLAKIVESLWSQLEERSPSFPNLSWLFGWWRRLSSISLSLLTCLAGLRSADSDGHTNLHLHPFKQVPPLICHPSVLRHTFYFTLRRVGFNHAKAKPVSIYWRKGIEFVRIYFFLRIYLFIYSVFTWLTYNSELCSSWT